MGSGPWPSPVLVLSFTLSSSGYSLLPAPRTVIRVFYSFIVERMAASTGKKGL